MKWGIFKWNIISEINDRIVIDLAKNGPAVGYQVAKRTGIARSSTYKGLKQLLEQGIVERHDVPECKGILKKKEYSLTVRGLVEAFASTKEEEWQSIIKKWPDLIPLVTGKWDIFVSAGVEDLAWKKLIRASSDIAIGIKFYQYTMDSDGPIDRAEEFHHRFYDPELELKDREERLKWAEVCASDPDVRDYLIVKWTMIIESYTIRANEVKLMTQVLQDVKDADSE